METNLCTTSEGFSQLVAGHETAFGEVAASVQKFPLFGIWAVFIEQVSAAILVFLFQQCEQFGLLLVGQVVDVNRCAYHG